MSTKMSIAENLNTLIRTMMAGFWTTTNGLVINSAANGHVTSQYVNAYFLYSSIMTIVFVWTFHLFIHEMEDAPALFREIGAKIRNKSFKRKK